MLAEEIITRFHDKNAATAAREGFIARFQQGTLPEDIKEVKLNVANEATFMAIGNMIRDVGFAPSVTEAQRLVEQGGVLLDNVKISDKALKVAAGKTYLLQVGKRKFAKVTI